MKTKNSSTLIIGIACILTLACSFVQRFLFNQGGPNVPMGLITQVANPVRETDKCNATKELEVTGILTRDDTNEFGTKQCEFTFRIENTNPTQVIWIVARRHETDIWQKTDVFDWALLGNVNPTEIEEWFGYHTIYSDPDATGASVLRIERIVGVYDLPECLSLRSDEVFLDYVAKEIPSACPGY